VIRSPLLSSYRQTLLSAKLIAKVDGWWSKVMGKWLKVMAGGQSEKQVIRRCLETIKGGEALLCPGEYAEHPKFKPRL